MKTKIKLLFVSAAFVAMCNNAGSQNIAVNTTGTAAAAANMFEVTQTSTAANMVAIYAINSGASPGNTGYGLYSTKTGASATNIAGYFTATGATNNYAGIFDQGYVGIGTTSPSNELEVSVNSTVDPTSGGLFGMSFLNRDLTANALSGILFRSYDDGGTARHGGAIVAGKESNWVAASGNYPGFISLWTRQSATSEFERMRITSVGNVGIGTATPLAKLHIVGAGEASPAEGYDITNANVANVLKVDASGNAVYNGGVIELGSGLGPGAYIKSGQVNGAQSRLYFGTYKGVNVMTPDLTINNNGYVGIGTTAPAAKLEVAGAVNAIRTNYLDIHGDNGGTTDRPYIRGMSDHLVIAPRSLAGVGNTMYICWPGDMGAGSTVNTRLQETLFISSTSSTGGGNVGIGTSAPAAKLEVDGASGSTIKIVDGNQGPGKVLTSDANGQGSWQPNSGGCLTQYVQEYTAAGTYTWTWPATAKVVSVEIWGAGGGGAAGRLDCGQGNGWQNTADGGSGGSAGAYISRTNVPVSADVVVVVGAGGAGGPAVNAHNTNSNGVAGGNSSFGTIVAPGGPRGTVIGAPGGAGTLYQGTFGFQCTGGWDGGAGAYMWSCGGGGTGGNGASNGNGTAYGGGGGGGGSGTGGNGGAGKQGGAGNATTGGNGTVYGAGGGGGGGYGDYSCCSGSCPTTHFSGAGGNGATGYVKVTWWQ